MVTGVGNATLYQGNLVKGYLTISKKPGVWPISIPHPLGWGGRTQFDLFVFPDMDRKVFMGATGSAGYHTSPII